MKKALVLLASITVISAAMLTLSGCSGNAFFKALRNTTEEAAELPEGFSGIEIESDTADLTFVTSSKGKIEYTTHKKVTYSTKVEDGILKIKYEDNRRWFEKVFNFGDSSLAIYLPAGEYSSLSIKQDTGDINIPADYKFGSVDIDLSTGDTKFCASANESIKIHSSTGNITLENASCGTLDTKVSTGNTHVVNVSVTDGVTISASTGDVSVNNVNCGGKFAVQTSSGKISASNITCSDMTATVSSGDTNLTAIGCVNFAATGNTGDIDMNALIASGTIDISRSTGDIYFDGCDAAEVYVVTDTGSVKGTLLTDKIFQVYTSTGKINVPECWEGGKCKITTSTGDVKISIGE